MMVPHQADDLDDYSPHSLYNTKPINTIKSQSQDTCTVTAYTVEGPFQNFLVVIVSMAVIQV
jgi:hypothetical protein